VVGEISSGSSPTNTPGITLVPSGALEVVADFAESDAAKVQVGDPVTVTFAALAGATATGTVSAVDGVATTGTNALVTYGVRVQLTDAPEGVSEGMTASVTVTVDEVTDVLFLPPGVITERDGQAFVLRPGPEDTTEEVTITLGLKGDIGTEVTGGLAVGDTVLVPKADESGAQQPDSGIPGGSD
jgi:macrolide-specific efflux system membrane fusion protein